MYGVMTIECKSYKRVSNKRSRANELRGGLINLPCAGACKRTVQVHHYRYGTTVHHLHPIQCSYVTSNFDVNPTEAECYDDIC